MIDIVPQGIGLRERGCGLLREHRGDRQVIAGAVGVAGAIEILPHEDHKTMSTGSIAPPMPTPSIDGGTPG